eukprot:5845229-Amphidinium_carterae.1
MDQVNLCGHVIQRGEECDIAEHTCTNLMIRANNPKHERLAPNMERFPSCKKYATMSNFGRMDQAVAISSFRTTNCVTNQAYFLGQGG